VTGRRRAAARVALPTALLAVLLRPRSRLRSRVAASAGLVALWSVVYARYRRQGRAESRHEYQLLRTANRVAFTRHYNERVPTIEEEFELWGPFHQHRHEMRYDLVAAEVRRHAAPGSVIVDIGCGAGLVADRLPDLDATYIGLDLPGHHIRFAAEKFADRQVRLRHRFVRADGERLPLVDGGADIVVLSEVIEHLLRPELAVWEIARVLRHGGILVLTTNNASEVPLRSPLTHLFAWLEKAVGADHPRLISRRPWVWPEPVHGSLLPPGSDPVYLPHTHHILAEIRDLLAAAGLDTTRASTFEFPPPQAATTAFLDRRGELGRRVVDGVEAVATRLPLVNRLGCHLLLVARKVRSPVAADPPPGVWPGPFSA